MHLTHLLRVRRVRLRLLHSIGLQALLALFLLAGFCLPTQAQCTIEFVDEFPGLNGPGGVATDSAGNVYVTDVNIPTSSIVKLSSTGTLITTFGTFGFNNGEFFAPVGVAIDGNGNILVADTGNHRIQKLNSTGTHVFTVGALPTGTIGAGAGEFNNPTFIAADAAGNIYVSDTGNNRIQKFDSTGVYITEWFVNTPAGVAIDSSGNVLVMEQGTLLVRKFTNTGTPLLAWGGGPGTGNGQFGGVPNGPIGLAVDANDNVYAVDTDNNRVQIFTNNGTYLTQFGTPGAGNGQFDFPVGIAVDNSGNIYVADLRNFRVQKFRQICGAGGPSSQRPGSALVFPYYTSNSATKADTRLTISNVGTQNVSVHIFFIDGTSCNQADQFLCLTPNASFAFKASEYDPEATGYLLAVAVDSEGRPVRNNALIGNAFVNDGDYVDNYGATGFWGHFPNVATLNANGTATLNFNGSAYDRVPNQFAVELQSPLDAAGQRIVTASLQGDLTTSTMTGASQVGTGLVYNGNEKPFGSFSGFLKGTCQAIATISTTNPRVPNGLGVVIPKGQVGSMKITTGAAVGLIMTPRTATWKGIRGLHVLGTTNATITIPMIRPVC